MSIELYNEKKLLRKTDTFIPLLSDKKDRLDYYINRVAELEYQNNLLQETIKELKKYETVKEFYNALSGYCMDMNITANILQCGFRVSNKKCSIEFTCKTRITFLKQIGVL